METGCVAAERFALLWEERGESAELEAGLADFETHLNDCPACRRRYGPLLALIERDASARSARAPDMVFVEGVMAALPRRPGVEAGGRRRLPLPAVAAAAAVLLVIAGLSISRAGIISKSEDTIAIHFTLDAPDASSVVLVGSFSDWSVSDRFRLKRVNASAKTWDLSVRLKRNELYSYGFLVDGEKWLADPLATEAIDDGFGNKNSLLRL